MREYLVWITRALAEVIERRAVRRQDLGDSVVGAPTDGRRRIVRDIISSHSTCRYRKETGAVERED